MRNANRFNKLNNACLCALSSGEKMMNNELEKRIQRAYGNKLDLEVVSMWMLGQQNQKAKTK